MAEKNIGIKIDADLYKKIKIKIAQEDITLKDYILNLIQKDLESDK